MRVAIFSDVHGNLTALEAVLEDIEQQGVDTIFFAGDLCIGGARPAECLERVREEAISAVHGNTDLLLCNQPLLSDDVQAEKRRAVAEIDSEADWTLAQLSVGDRAWLRTLPFHRRVSPTVNPRDDIFIVHANPVNTTQHIQPSEERQKELYGEVLQSDDDLTLRRTLGELTGGILAFGHLHVPNIRHWQNHVLVNISSVSLPLDGDQRAKYGLFTWNGRWEIEHQYVPYDVAAEVDLLASVRPPNWETLADRLQTGRIRAKV